MASGPAPALTTTPTATPSLTMAVALAVSETSIVPIIPAAIVGFFLVVVILIICWCTIRSHIGSLPTWRPEACKVGPMEQLKEPKDRRSSSIAPPQEGGTKPPLHPTVPKPRARMHSYAPDSDTPDSGEQSNSDPGTGAEAKPLIPYYIPEALEALYAAPGTPELKPSSVPSSARSCRSPRSVLSGAGTTDKLSALRTAVSETIETLHLPNNSVPGKFGRGRILSDASNSGTVWGAAIKTPPTGTWSVINDADVAAAAAVDRHIDQMVSAEVASLNAHMGLRVDHVDEGPNDIENPEPPLRPRRRRASSIDSDKLAEANLRRSRYLTPQRERLSVSSVSDLGGPDALLQSVASTRLENISDDGDGEG